MYEDPLTYQTQSSLSPEMSAAFFVGLGIFMLLAYVVTAIFLGMIFKKAGEEQWKAWVPVYNNWVMLELGGQPGWIALLNILGIIPFVGWIGSLVAYVFTAIAAHRIGVNFGKDGVFVLLFIFLPLVWLIWLAVDSKAIWKKSGSTVEPTDAPTNNPPSPNQPASM